MRLNGWKIAKEWYRESEVARSTQQSRSITAESHDKIPTDVYSIEFAIWLTDQYRLAMAKGIQLVQEELGKSSTSEDDGELVTVEWWKSMSMSNNEPDCIDLRGAFFLSLYEGSVYLECRVIDVDGRQDNRSIRLHNVKTSGDVRRLLAALGDDW